MTIILDNLDKRKAYICLERGTSLISKEIQRLTKQFAPGFKREEIPSHIYMLVYEKPNWVIYESHMKAIKEFEIPSGVRSYKTDYPFVKQVLERSDCYPVKLNRKTMRSHLGEAYGVKDIIELAKVCIKRTNGSQADKPGLICSEYAALCFKDIQRVFKLPAHCITPAHFLCYFTSK